MASNCLVSDAQSVNDDCPSSEWQAIQLFLCETNNDVPLLYQSITGPISPSGLQVTGRQSHRQLTIRDFHYNPGYGASHAQNVAFGSSQHAAVADALPSTAMMWNQALNNVTTSGHGSVLDQLDAIHSITTDYYQPYTLVSCGHDTIQGQTDEHPVVFPVLQGSEAQMLDRVEFDNYTISVYGFKFSGLSRSQNIGHT